MKRETIVKVMWTALGIHGLYLLFVGVIACFQRQVLNVYMSGFDDARVFPVLFLLSGSILYLIMHAVLTVILVRRLQNGSVLIAVEVIGAVLFGAVFPLVSLVGQRMVTLLIGYRGSAALASYSVIMQSFSLFTIVRGAAIALLLLSCGMSICCKRNG